MVKYGVGEWNLIVFYQDDSFLKTLKHLLLLLLQLIDNGNLLNHFVYLSLLSIVNVWQLLVAEHKKWESNNDWKTVYNHVHYIFRNIFVPVNSLI
jgi:hypothetical protein